MAWVIAGIYEIQKQIGAGGGGIVYLGRHLRLNKQIVLKADRRTLNTKAEILRREVDMLKELSHTYIPQVYDFVQEDGVVYTVMDYIEGESLDQLLKRGQIPGQPQVIQWACQLLEALCYLHSRPPHGILHGDIKPANIMLRPDGNICLIDYNIALALGEDGAVQVGFSRGYASPEHYGSEYFAGRAGRAAGMPWNGISREMAGTPEYGEPTETAGMPGYGEPTETAGMPGYGEPTETMGMPGYGEPTETMGMAGYGELTETAGMPGYGEPTETMGMSEYGKSTETGGTPVAMSCSHAYPATVMLDARSDIYSLGATLYHLLSGQRPPQDARVVKPLGADVCSPEVSKIIRKAMASDPALRYQSAEEMLTAFRQLHKKDSRVLRHRRHAVTAAAVSAVLFLIGGACTFIGMKRLERTQEALVLAEYSANSLAEGNVSEAIRLALKAIPEKESLLEPPATAQARKALTDALGVYDLADGFKPVDIIELPSAPFGITVSPDGLRLAAVYQGEVAVYDLESRRKLVSLPVQDSALSEAMFVDEDRLVYAGEKGITAFDLRTGKTLWTGETATTLALSGDRTVVAAVDRDADHAFVYRMEDGTKITDCSFEGQRMEVAANDIFANPGNRIFALNGNGKFLAVSFSGGGLWIFDLEDPDENMVIYDETTYEYFEGGFCGKYFAFASDKSDESFFGLVDTEEGVYAGELESRDHFFVTTEKEGIYLANRNLLVRLDLDTFGETELAYTDDANIARFSVGEAGVLAVTDKKSVAFYDNGANLISSEESEENFDFALMAGEYAILAGRNGPYIRILKKESHETAQVMSYDARFAHDEARLSQDGQTVMLFDYRNFRICNMEGEVLTQGEFPDSEHIYDQQYRRDGEDSWLEVIWYDGTVRCYNAADGSLISETRGEPPDDTLYEEFFTERYRIVSSLHGAPEVYDRKSGRKIAGLETEAYLTYVTQVGEYIVTEYVSAAGERYGLLLNDRLETLARLPGLCDISGETLIFDYESGNLRQCRLYSLQELVALGETYLKEENQEGEEK